MLQIGGKTVGWAWTSGRRPSTDAAVIHHSTRSATSSPAPLLCSDQDDGYAALREGAGIRSSKPLSNSAALRPAAGSSSMSSRGAVGERAGKFEHALLAIGARLGSADDRASSPRSAGARALPPRQRHDRARMQARGLTFDPRGIRDGCETRR